MQQHPRMHVSEEGNVIKKSFSPSHLSVLESTYELDLEMKPCITDALFSTWGLNKNEGHLSSIWGHHF